MPKCSASHFPNDSSGFFCLLLLLLLALLMLLLSHDRIVEIKVLSGAAHSPHRHAFSEPIFSSFTFTLTFAHTLLDRSLCIYADDLTIIEMLFVRCFISFRALLSFPSFLSFLFTTPSSSSLLPLNASFSRSRFYYFGQKLWIKIKTIYVL